MRQRSYLGRANPLVAFREWTQKYPWLLAAALVALAAWLDARGIMCVVGARLQGTGHQRAAPSLTARIPSAPAPGTPHVSTAAALVARNPFDSVQGPLVAAAYGPTASTPEFPPGVESNNPTTSPECEGVRVRIIAASSDRRKSVAAIESTVASLKNSLNP